MFYRVPQFKVTAGPVQDKTHSLLCSRKDKSLGDIFRISPWLFLFLNIKEEVIPIELLILIVAGILETGWAIGLKYSEGFTKLIPSVFTVVGMIASFYFLSLALKSLPLGTAYAVWTGVGTVGTVILGIILFKEPADIFRLICIGFIVVGIAGLKIVSPH